MATGDNLKSTKAVAAAVLGFFAPGAAYLTGVAGDGTSTNELVVALCFCVGGAVAFGGVVQRVENKPKVISGRDESPYTPPSVQP
jgi:predicted phage tail protein